MSLKNLDSKVFSHKGLSIIMMAFGSFMIATGPLYSYFIFTTVGSDGLGDVMFSFVAGIIALPAGLLVCIVGKKLKGPIIKVNNQEDKQQE
ncbi:MAG: hypothetical protein P8I94_09710 [Emcibacteraceae bacterium]|nr:hypothetical protein [Emcibacteraceae bacterium]